MAALSAKDRFASELSATEAAERESSEAKLSALEVSHGTAEAALRRELTEALDERDGRRWTEIISLTINLEHAGDIIERILQDAREKKIAHNLAFSEAGMQEISQMHARVVANLRLGLSVFLSGDLKSAQQLMAEKATFREMERQYARTHLQRIAVQTAESIETSSLHLDVISDLKRLNSLFCATAYPVLEDAGVLNRSRMKEDDGEPPARAVPSAQAH